MVRKNKNLIPAFLLLSGTSGNETSAALTWKYHKIKWRRALLLLIAIVGLKRFSKWLHLRHWSYSAHQCYQYVCEYAQEGERAAGAAPVCLASRDWIIMLVLPFKNKCIGKSHDPTAIPVTCSNFWRAKYSWNFIWWCFGKMNRHTPTGAPRQPRTRSIQDCLWFPTSYFIAWAVRNANNHGFAA